MPAAAVIVPALATLGGAAIASRQSSKATQAQERATQQALAFERERETARRNAAEQANAAYRRQWDAWQAQRMGLMKRYGMNIPAQTQAPQARASMSLAALTRPVEQAPMQTAPSKRRQSLSLADLQNWSGF